MALSADVQSRGCLARRLSGGRAGGRRPAQLLLGVVGAVALLVLMASPASAATITSPGPLTNITVTPDLNCAVNHIADSDPEFFGGTACATLVAVGGTLYGPANIPAGGGATPRTTYTLVSQSPVTGAGTVANPYRIVTVVDLGTSGLRLTQTDLYVVGQESYRTDVQLTNTGATPRTAIVYRAGDCYLQNSDDGYGLVGSPAGAIACTTNPPPNTGGRIEQWLPITPGSHYFEAGYSTVWARIGAQLEFPDTCLCTSFIDNGAGLSWRVTIAPGASVTLSSIITFSPTGVAPLSVTKTADATTVPASGGSGYTVTVHNPNASPVVLNSISDTLPGGFTYTPGSTTGATTANPSIAAQTLTWAGPFNVPASGTLSLHFGVTVSSTAGTYFNNATADAGAVTVAPTGNTAPITVTGGVSTICSVAPVPGSPMPGYNVVNAQPGAIAYGTAGKDVMYGTVGDDRMAGLGGDDILFGFGGSDQLSGGEGNDSLCGGDGRDYLAAGNGNDLLSGDAGDDDLSAGAGDDRLFGGPGADRLAGGDGTDTCTAGGDAGDLPYPAPQCDSIL